MKFSYEDLISGDAIFVDGVGHLRSPKLKELKPTEGIGQHMYQLYLAMLSWDKRTYLNSVKVAIGKDFKKIEENDRLTVFDSIILLNEPRKLLQDAIAFFMLEELRWDNEKYRFLSVSKDNGEQVGVIDRNNFEDVKNMILQLNYIGIGESAAPVRFASEKTKQLWERAQEYLKKEKKEPNKAYNLGNVVSKLCASNTGYTLVNIFDLTVFQLYDQFFQYGYLRAMNINDMAFSNYGGEKFNIEEWLKPLLKI